MRMVFNLQATGLGNNGGSRTLIKCAETLKELGVDVKICSPTNRYSWHKISVEVVKRIPPCDVLVATGYASVQSTRRFKFHLFIIHNPDKSMSDRSLQP